MAVPAFTDISKASNDVLGKDFYHLTPVSLDVKTVAANGVTFTAKGKSAGDKLSGNLETKYSDKKNGLTLTQGWNTANALDTKVELADTLTPGLKAEVVGSVVPDKKKDAKLNLTYAHQAFTARTFLDLLKGPTVNADFTAGKDGVTLGGTASYDINAASVTKYAFAVGYKAPDYSISLSALDNVKLFSAGYYHKVSPLVEVGGKATYDSKSSIANPVALEVATKYQVDSTAFVKAKIADSGIASFAYSQDLRKGVKLGLGAAIDVLKLNEATHKLGVSLSFSA
ncbi:hypothetical protein LJB42_001224 [Komagataella kurtzmanii]|nr:hypothetical protein LJB42_001224 [Komagataella kurtzmanii]